MDKNELMTYRFFDAKGRRLAIYAQPVITVGELDTTMPAPSSLHIYVATCSKKDFFNKKKVRDGFLNSLKFRTLDLKHTIQIGEETAKLQEFNLEFTPGKMQSDFIRWCNTNFYRNFTTYLPADNTLMEIKMLVKDPQGENTEILIVKDSVKFHAKGTLNKFINIETTDTLDAFQTEDSLSDYMLNRLKEEEEEDDEDDDDTFGEGGTL